MLCSIRVYPPYQVFVPERRKYSLLLIINQAEFLYSQIMTEATSPAVGSVSPKRETKKSSSGQLATSIYAIVSLGFCVAFMAVLGRVNSEFSNQLWLSAFLILCGHIFEILCIGALLALTKYCDVNLKPCNTCVKFTIGLWGSYMFAMFIYAQIVLFGKSDAYVESLREVFICTLVWVIYIYIGILFSVLYTLIKVAKCPSNEEGRGLIANPAQLRALLAAQLDWQA